MEYLSFEDNKPSLSLKQEVFRWEEYGTGPSGKRLRKIAGLVLIKYTTNKILGGREEVRDWLEAENPCLDGESPMDVIRRGHVQPVLRALSQLISEEETA